MSSSQEVIKYNYGFKNNWDSFLTLAKSRLSLDHYWGDLLFVYNKDDDEDAYVFEDHEDLDKWLDEKFWDWCLYENDDLESSMDDFKVWKLIKEEEAKRFPTLYRGAKRTSLEVDGVIYYRTPVHISVEQTILITTESY